MIQGNDRVWANEFWNKLRNKIAKNTPIIGATFPYSAQDGKYEEFAKDDDIAFWTNGFWPGILWLMYNETGDNIYKDTAERCEELLDEALHNFDALLHDVGFMWQLSAVANYRLTGNNRSRQRGLIAASILSARYNIKGKVIRAWNPKELQNYAIIDCMMNLPLLYWATEATEDMRFSYIAELHADTCMKKIIRPDGSSNHIVEFNMENGDVISTPFGQGYESGSSWSRGQAWAIYGFVLSYIYTKKKEYLDTAKIVAHYFMFCMEGEDIPDADFRAPKLPVFKDSSAGVIAACGMIEIAKNVSAYEKNVYIKNAIRLLKSVEKYCDFSDECPQILNMCSTNYGAEHTNIIWGEFFLADALTKLLGSDFLIW